MVTHIFCYSTCMIPIPKHKQVERETSVRPSATAQWGIKLPDSPEFHKASLERSTIRYKLLQQLHTKAEGDLYKLDLIFER